MQSLPALTSSNLLFFCCLSRFSRSAFSFAARALLCFSSVSLCLKFSFSACCRAETEKMWGEEKKKRKHDGLLSGVNYNSAKPVKEGGSSQTLMKSLSGTTKVRWSFLAALWFKSSETKKKKKKRTSYHWIQRLDWWDWCINDQGIKRRWWLQAILFFDFEL